MVTNVTSKQFWVTFIERGLETLEVDEEFEVIDAVEDDVDTVSFFEVDKSFQKGITYFLYDNGCLYVRCF